MRLSMRTIVLAVSLLLPLLSRAQGREEITVSAAISLKDAFTELGRLYETRTKVHVVFNFGGSGALRNQIEAGAPVDLFAPADAREMDAAESRGLVERATRVRFALNHLVLVEPASARAHIASFADLASSLVSLIALGDPRTVPAGRYAREVLTKMGIYEAVKDKFIYAENVRQALDYVARGEVDAGVVYATDVRAREREVRLVATAADSLHTPIEYPIATVRGTKHKESAMRFIELLHSEEGKKILRAHGFTTGN